MLFSEGRYMPMCSRLNKGSPGWHIEARSLSFLLGGAECVLKRELPSHKSLQAFSRELRVFSWTQHIAGGKGLELMVFPVCLSAGYNLNNLPVHCRFSCFLDIFVQKCPKVNSAVLSKMGIQGPNPHLRKQVKLLFIMLISHLRVPVLFQVLTTPLPIQFLTNVHLGMQWMTAQALRSLLPTWYV